jgi:ribosomal protein S27AE
MSTDLQQWSGYFAVPIVKQPRIRYGEYPQHLDPTVSHWIDRYYVYPELQERAARSARWAIKHGYIQRDTCCQCGGDVKMNAHHDSYALFWMIRWLCYECHMEMHKGWRYDRDHTSQREQCLGLIIWQCEKNLTTWMPVAPVPEFIEDIQAIGMCL